MSVDQVPTEPPRPTDDVGSAAKVAAVLGAVFAIVALGAYGPRTALSVLVGATVGVANLLALRAIIRGMVTGPPEPPADDPNRSPESGEAERGRSAGAGLAWGLLAVLKVVFFFGGVWLLLSRRLVDPMPLVVGYGVMPLGIAASAVWSSVTSGRKR